MSNSDRILWLSQASDLIEANRPLPRVWWVLTRGFVKVTVLWAILLVVSFFASMFVALLCGVPIIEMSLTTETPLNWDILTGVVVMFTIWAVKKIEVVKPSEQIKRYWERNVCGRKLLVQARWKQGGSGEKPEVSSIILVPGSSSADLKFNGDSLERDDYAMVALLLPLGGWFRQSGKVFSIHQGSVIALRATCDLSYPYSFVVWDDVGSRLMVSSIYSLMQICRFFGVGYGHNATIGTLLYSLEQEVDAHEQSLGVMVDILDNIKTTTRFFQSKEAQKIREEAICEIRQRVVELSSMLVGGNTPIGLKVYRLLCEPKHASLPSGGK